MSIKIAMGLIPQYGCYEALRDAWIESEELGADSLWTADHFFAQKIDAEQLAEGQVHKTGDAENFEAMTMQTAMAATTKRADIGCLVHAIGYRNPNLTADMARCIDHVSGGRFILGLGAGFSPREYEEYGYDYGTQKSRLLDLKAALPVIESRLEKLNPPPVRKIPILIASMGDKIGLPIVAEFADMWHVIGPMDKMRQKHEVLLQHCEKIGRDPAEIEIVAACMPSIFPDNDPDVLVDELGAKHINTGVSGPDWDLAPLKELIEWRKNREE